MTRASHSALAHYEALVHNGKFDPKDPTHKKLEEGLENTLEGDLSSIPDEADRGRIGKKLKERFLEAKALRLLSSAGRPTFVSEHQGDVRIRRGGISIPNPKGA